MRPVLDVLEEIAAIHNFTYWPHSGACGEELSTPPVLWLRYEEPSEEIASLLRRAVSTFRGQERWELLTTPGLRWALMPARIREHADLHGCIGHLDAAGELKESDPEFGKRANAELRALAEHIRRSLKNAA